MLSHLCTNQCTNHFHYKHLRQTSGLQAAARITQVSVMQVQVKLNEPTDLFQHGLTITK